MKTVNVLLVLAANTTHELVISAVNAAFAVTICCWLTPWFPPFSWAFAACLLVEVVLMQPMANPESPALITIHPRQLIALLLSRFLFLQTRHLYRVILVLAVIKIFVSYAG